MSTRNAVASNAPTIEPPPFLKNPDDWIGVKEAARCFRRAERTIQMWCVTGTFAEFSVRTYQDILGVWHINVPKSWREKQNARRAKAAASP